MTKKDLFIFLGGGLLLYLVSTGISFAAFSYLGGGGKAEEIRTPLGGDGVVFDESLPKTEECLLNGALWSKPQREWWEKHRPLGVMIENHEEARPQSGLTKADIIYEAVAEGGITRFLAIYYCQDAEFIGPVRSARTYFLDWISEYGDFPLYAHVGGANCNVQTGSGCANGAKADALGQISGYGWASYNDMNQFSLGFPTFWRDYERMGRAVATEHTVYSTTTKLWEAAKKRGLTEKDEEGKKWDKDFEEWSFKDEVSEADRPVSFIAEFGFWEGYAPYLVRWEYDPSLNSYKRFNGGQPHIDKNSGAQLASKNIVLAFMREQSANDGYEGNIRLLYGTEGKGEAIILQDGQKINGTWEKKDREERTKFYNSKGKEIEFNPGQIWIEILPLGTEIEYK